MIKFYKYDKYKIDMKRRDFLKSTLAAGVSSMTPKFSFGKNKTINTIGIVSDIEGDFLHIKRSALQLKRENVDLIVIAGDLYENSTLRSFPTMDKNISDVDQMVLGIRYYADLGVPVFVIPGNHEEQKIFSTALFKLSDLGYRNIMDLSGKFISYDNFSLVGIGGYHESSYTIKSGFLLTKKQYEKLAYNLNLATQKNKLTLFISHAPPKTNSAIDRTYEGKNVGDERFSEFLNDPNVFNLLHICGGVHEAGGHYFNFSQSKVSINTASVSKFSSDTKNRATIIYVNSNSLSWKFIG